MYNNNNNYNGNRNYNGNNNYNRNNNNNNQQNAPKKSGATYSKISKGNFVGATIVNAWKTSKSTGLITCKVAPYGKSKKYKNAKGEEKQTMIATVNYHRSGHEKMFPCSINLKTQVVSLDKIGMCITPNGRGTTSSGKRVTGYFGRFK